MGAIREIFGKEPSAVELSDIRNLVDNKIEETKILEYKAPGILSHASDLSQWVSSFLNAEGGLIIIGVCEDNPNGKEKLKAKIYPTKIEYVDEEYTKERIEQLIFGNISCSVKPDIRIFPVRDRNDSSKTIFLIEIAPGDYPPYQAADHKYYRRLNVTKYPLAHYEIAEYFGRRRRPKLTLECIVSNPLNIRVSHEREIHPRPSYRLQILITNDGNAVAKYARVIISFEGIEIKKVISGPNLRIDRLRNNMPTLQWDNPLGVIYCGPSADMIWELEVRVKRSKWGLISWETIAEDTDITRGDWVLLGLETAEAGETKQPYRLRSQEEVFRTPLGSPTKDG